MPVDSPNKESLGWPVCWIPLVSERLFPWS